MRRLQDEVRVLDVQADFVRVSLIKRRIVAAEKKLDALRRAQADSWAVRTLPRVERATTPVVLVALWFAFRGAPVMLLPPGLFSPFNWLVAKPDGAVSAFIWISVCYSVAGRAVPAALTAAGVMPVVEKKDLMGQARAWLGF